MWEKRREETFQKGGPQFEIRKKKGRDTSNTIPHGIKATESGTREASRANLLAFEVKVKLAENEST